MTVVSAYGTVLQETLAQIFEAEANAIERAAQLASESITEGGVLHIFGTGHSHMVAFEAFGRAGGLAAVNAIVDIALTAFNHGRDGKLERLHGYAEILLETEDLREGEVVIVVSNSGINAVPIEFALGCKARGLHVVAITNLRHSQESPSRHSSGRKLFEIAEVVIDNHGVPGDAGISLSNGESVGPTSTVAGAAIIDAITARIAEIVVERGVDSPVLVSQNLAGMEDRNRALIERYRDRSRLL
ncbi:MAG: SIS domain-containing protein [Gemmatimonadetes bacterium]|nr:SIS domain-containing protein [Gemmatimonadota bacterium]